MLRTRDALATPAPSSDHDVIYPPEKATTSQLSGCSTFAQRLPTPPLSSPPRDTPRAEAFARLGCSPTKPVRAPMLNTKDIKPPRLVTMDTDNLSLPVNYTHTYVFGRCKDTERATQLAASPAFLGTQPVCLVCLPESAKHASRVHALLRWVPFSRLPGEDGAPIGTFVVRILGQNGLVVHNRRLRPGQVVRLLPGTTPLDFFGATVYVDTPPATTESAALPAPARASVTAVSPNKPMRTPQATLPRAPSPEADPVLNVPSSPPRWHHEPAMPAPESERDATPEPRSSSPEAELRAPRVTPSKVSAKDSAAALLEQARMLVTRLAPTYDLAGLLASAIVFHRTATISVSEAVRSVLASTPSMLRGEAGARAAAFSPSSRKILSDEASTRAPGHGERILSWRTDDPRWATAARQAWHERLEQELNTTPMFGEIQRPGKDTRGNPLECWYYYDKEQDVDRERAENLGAFVKPMRNAVRSQKPIFWKKSEYGRATSHNGAVLEEEKLPYSPRSFSDESKPRARKGNDVFDLALDEPEQTWDRHGDQEWSARPRKKRATPSHTSGVSSPASPSS
ncbi:hypothetical protein MEQU1_003270 [Malassezia equina]|uniref:FHA domain-containing protein n=1 Tax=Malassezia equina TaxID=1381935 RepID=A0AAF0EDV1_9BASI|nr:hypothetical protein MEQU1_003270 [Malassezia equina]